MLQVILTAPLAGLDKLSHTIKHIVNVIMKCTKVLGTLARPYANDTCAYLISMYGISRVCHFSQND